MLETLKAFDLDHLTGFYADAAPAVDATVGLTEGRRLVQRVHKRTALDLLRVTNAAQVLDTLPGRDESLHVIMNGNFHAWDLCPAVLRLATPAKCTELLVATLGFNAKNAKELLTLLDAGEIGAVRFLCSCYFRGACAEEFGLLAEGLKARGQQIRAARTHAKIMGFRFNDGRHYVIESSANLRSCHNVEQFSMTESPELYRFHRAWITDMLAQEQEVKNART